MKHLIVVLLVFVTLASCTKEPTTPNAPTAITIQANLDKQTLTDVTVIAMNHSSVAVFSGTITWGDGNTTIINETSSTTYTNAMHTYAAVGLYTITLTLNQPTAVSSFTIDLKGNNITHPDRLVSLTGLDGLPNIKALVLQSCLLPTVDISGNPLLFSLFLGGNSFPVSVVNSILVDRANSGILIGVVSLKQTPAAIPTGAGATAATNLNTLPKTWSVMTDQ